MWLEVCAPWALQASDFNWLSKVAREPSKPFLTLMYAAKRRPSNAALYQVDSKGCAVIRISGVLVKDPAYLRKRGYEVTAYSEIIEVANQAASDRAVKQIHLAVDSPGGEVAGLDGAVSALWEARQSKFLSAHIEDVGASGAYWLCSQAEVISAGRNAVVGSIGVFCVYNDTSGADTKAGVHTIVIRSGPNKGMGVDKITDKQIAGEQQRIDAIANNSIVDIARGRNVSSSRIWQLATGRTWLAGAAREMGLIDEVDLPPRKANDRN